MYVCMCIAGMYLTLYVCSPFDHHPPTHLPTYLPTYVHRLGLNIEIKDGKIELLEAFTACEQGKPISPEQAKLMVCM